MLFAISKIANYIRQNHQICRIVVTHVFRFCAKNNIYRSIIWIAY